MAIELTDTQITEYCLNIANKIRGKYDFLYAVPMGGYPVAIEISKYSGIPINNKITPRALIIDDLIDSGKTLSRFTNDKAVLIVKNNKESEVTYFADKINDWVQFPWEGETTVDANITRIIQFIGDNPNREGLIETPARVRKSYDELFSGYKKDPKEILKIFNDGACDEMVILKDIEFYESKVVEKFIPIIITKNNYQLNLFNGDIGFLIDEEQKTYAYFIDEFDKEQIKKYPISTLTDWEPAYCLTVHKSQGSEFDYIELILPENIEKYPFITLELIYTAITRARKDFTIFC